MHTLTVLYDPSCGLCVRCREWMEHQPSYVRLAFVACSSREARGTYGDIPWLGDDLVVVSDEGDVWAGPAAFIVCLWALEDWREWSYRLSGSCTAKLAEHFFHAISARRKTIARWIRRPACEGDTCRVSAHRPRTAFR